MGVNEGRDGRNRPRILVGMGSRRKGGRGDAAPRPPEVDTLAVHDAVTTNSRKAQHR